MNKSITQNLLLVIVFGLLSIAASVLSAQTFTYTTDADFDQGTLFNVNHDAPNSDQLQLNTFATGFSFINIAASGRGTVERLDVNTGAIVGEYYTAPSGRGRNPSRTTVDLFGNVWVANRDESNGGQGSVTRIALIVGGTRVNSDGSLNPVGDYLAPPFTYSTAVDRDGDGLIKTSKGLGDVRPWTNAGGADNAGGVSTADDECIINYVRTASTNNRTVAIDANNDLWVGGTGNLTHQKISGLTGLPIAGTTFNQGCGGYGGVLDGNGILWSARAGAGLLRYDPTTNTGTCISIPESYGLAVDLNGNVWNSKWVLNQITKLSPAGVIIATYNSGGNGCRGVAVTADNTIWIANSNSNTVTRLRASDGVVLATVPVGNHPTGVAVDANGKVWVTNYNSHNTMRIDPATNTVDLTVALGAGASPYNYSDMTGQVALNTTAPQGRWNITLDGGSANFEWGTLTWNTESQGSVPAGAGISFDVRTANDLITLGTASYMPVTNGIAFTVAGQFLEVRATMTPDAAGVSPVLSDVSIEPGCNPNAGMLTGGTIQACYDAGAGTVSATANGFRTDYMQEYLLTQSGTVVMRNATGSFSPPVGDYMIHSFNYKDATSDGGITTGSTISVGVNNTSPACYEIGTGLAVSIVANPVPTITASDYNGFGVNCLGGSDGTATVDQIYVSYLWDDPAMQTTQMASGLSAGTYTVTVTDMNGCTGSESVTLTEPIQLGVNAGPDQTVYYGYSPMSCATLTHDGGSGGVGPYMFFWSTLEVTQSISVCPTITTEYCVMIIDANYCHAFDTVVVTVVDVRCGKKLDKVQVCHVPPTNPANEHEICIGKKAVPDHLSHGDYLGPCAGVPAPNGGKESKLTVSPNPAKSSAQISFMLVSDSDVSLAVYDAFGNKVKTLFKEKAQADMGYQFSFSPKSTKQNLYYIRLITGSGEQLTEKLLFIK